MPIILNSAREYNWKIGHDKVDTYQSAVKKKRDTITFLGLEGINPQPLFLVYRVSHLQ